MEQPPQFPTAAHGFRLPQTAKELRMAEVLLSAVPSA